MLVAISSARSHFLVTIMFCFLLFFYLNSAPECSKSVPFLLLVDLSTILKRSISMVPECSKSVYLLCLTWNDSKFEYLWHHAQNIVLGKSLSWGSPSPLPFPLFLLKLNWIKLVWPWPISVEYAISIRSGRCDQLACWRGQIQAKPS